MGSSWVGSRIGRWAPRWLRSCACAVLLTCGATASRGQTRAVPGTPRAETPAETPAEGRSLPAPTNEMQPRPSRYFSAEALEVAVDPTQYVLGPHDVLAFMLLIGEMRLERLPVLPEGVVLVPGVGAIPAAGRTLQEFRVALEKALKQRYRNFEVFCYLAESRQFRVHVMGEVREPGTLVARSYERVAEVIERAGGFTPNASRRNIELRDPKGAPTVHADLDAYYLRGELAANPLLAPGHIVFVPARKRRVEVVGAVAVPGIYEPLAGESVRALIDLAGGPAPQADLSHVSVDRIDAEGRLQVAVVDLTASTPVVEDLVRVSVHSALLGQRRVFIVLPDGRRETLYLADTETLRSLVGRVTLLDPVVALAEARLVTHDSTGATSETTVDVARVLRGEQDATLHDGDAFSIPAVRDYVYVTGMVARPGRFAYRADWSVGDYLGEAGGASPGGNRDRVSVFGRAGGTRGADRASSVERGETVHVNRSTSSKLANALGIVTSLSALVISVVALTQ